MARSKHRKNHKQALEGWRNINCRYLPREGTPVEVAKKRYQVRYPEPKLEASEGVAARVSGPGKLTITAPDGSALNNGGIDYFTFDSLANILPEVGMRADDPLGRRAGMSELPHANYANLEMRILAQHCCPVTGEPAPHYSMGCVVDPPCQPGTGKDLAEHVYGPDPNGGSTTL